MLVTALYFGVYGEIFSLFPATQGDTFGAKFAAANDGMLYTAKGAGALLVPIAAGISKAHGWSTVFGVAMTCNIIAALLALVRAETHASAALRRRLQGAAVGARRRGERTENLMAGTRQQMISHQRRRTLPRPPALRFTKLEAPWQP